MGPAGESANQNCVQCHENDTDLYVRQVQYNNSTHLNGGNFERSTTSCAGCHTHEGFLSRLASGGLEPASAPENPSPVNCRTCHQIHTNYDDGDYALTTSAAFTLAAGGSVNFGSGNLCAQCHQGRPLDADEIPVIDGPDVTFGSIRYGYHHGPQGNVLAGKGGIAFEGSEDIIEIPYVHGDEDVGCPMCHMAEPYGAQAGGHTWNMSYLYHGHTEDLIAGCQECHESIEDFDYRNLQSKVEVRLDSLRTLLRKIGIVNASSDYRVPGTWPANVAGAALNFQMVLEDRSMGIHNPPYVYGLLQNSIETVLPLVP